MQESTGEDSSLPIDLWGKLAGATHILMQRSILGRLHDTSESLGSEWVGCRMGEGALSRWIMGKTRDQFAIPERRSPLALHFLPPRLNWARHVMPMASGSGQLATAFDATENPISLRLPPAKACTARPCWPAIGCDTSSHCLAVPVKSFHRMDWMVPQNSRLMITAVS